MKTIIITPSKVKMKGDWTVDEYINTVLTSMYSTLKAEGSEDNYDKVSVAMSNFLASYDPDKYFPSEDEVQKTVDMEMLYAAAIAENFDEVDFEAIKANIKERFNTVEFEEGETIADTSINSTGEGNETEEADSTAEAEEV